MPTKTLYCSSSVAPHLYSVAIQSMNQMTHFTPQDDPQKFQQVPTRANLTKLTSGGNFVFRETACTSERLQREWCSTERLQGVHH